MNFFILYIGHFVQNMKSTFLLLITIKQRYNVCTILKGSHTTATLNRHSARTLLVHRNAVERGDATQGFMKKTATSLFPMQYF